MNKIIKIHVAFLLLLCISCSVKTKNKTEHKDVKIKSETAESNEVAVPKKQINNATEAYFKASGTEPFWSLELSEQQIKLRTPTDSIITSNTKPFQAMDKNVKMYKIKGETGQLNIQIIQSECANGMSGKISPYKVSVEYKKKSEPSVHKIEGCGSYITDYRLHDIWVLEKLNGKKVDKANFNNDLPSLEINATTNTFLGFAGCNRMNGKLFYEKELLRFTDINTTKIMCQSNNEENTYLKAFRSATRYKIENNRLWLSNPSEELLIFKKID